MDMYYGLPSFHGIAKDWEGDVDEKGRTDDFQLSSGRWNSNLPTRIMPLVDKNTSGIL